MVSAAAEKETAAGGEWVEPIDGTAETIGGQTFTYDKAAADAAVLFFSRYLRHTEGEWWGRPFILQPWQEFRIIRPAFGWKRGDGTRRYRVVYVEIPRKNGKTELAAGGALLLLVADGEPGAQVYSMAVDAEQASIVFNKASIMVGLSPALGETLECLKKTIFCPALMGSFKALSSNPASKHGFSPSGAIGDEIHEWRDSELADVVHEGTGARRQPLEFYITTAGTKGQGFGWEMHQRARSALNGELVDASFLPVIFAAGEDDDWTDPAVWAKANPGLGISPKREFLEAECAKAKQSAVRQNRFRRYYLNQWTEQAVRWLDMGDWKACAGDVPWQDLPEFLKGRRCYSGVDLSTKRDLTALAHVFPPQDEGGAWYVVPRFFLPEADLKERIKRDQVSYDEWHRAGALVLTKGNAIDYAFIQEQQRRDAWLFEVIECGFDPWNATQYAIQMQDEGMAMVEVRQGYGSLSEPSKEMERLLIDHLWRHGDHPVLTWNARNVAVTEDARENIKPAKDKSTGRIDGIAAMITALARAIVASTVEPIEIPDDYELEVI